MTRSERGFPWILTVLSAALLAVLIGAGRLAGPADGTGRKA